MTPEHVARVCRSAERKITRALPPDMMILLKDTGRKPGAIERMRLYGAAGTMPVFRESSKT